MFIAMPLSRLLRICGKKEDVHPDGSAVAVTTVSSFHRPDQRMASSLRRTDDLQRLKTRHLVLQNTDGTYPTTAGILYIDNATGHVGATSGATITGDGRISCTNIRAVSQPGDNNIFTNIAMQQNIAPNVVAGRIATGDTTDELFIESVRYIRMAGINSAYGQNTMVVDVSARNVDISGSLRVRNGTNLQTIGDNISTTTTSIWSNAGHTSGERKIGRLATDGATSYSPSGTFYVQGEKYVAITTIDNDGDTMPVCVDVSNNLSYINGSLVMCPIGSLAIFGNGVDGATVADPGFPSIAPLGQMYFNGATLWIKTNNGPNNGWKYVNLLP